MRNEYVSNKFMCVVIALCVVFVLAIGIATAVLLTSVEAELNHQHSPYESYEKYCKKEYKCQNCHSTDTHGFATFWNEDGTLVRGNLDYQKEHCAYTIMRCKTCGETFKLYRKQW